MSSAADQGYPVFSFFDDFWKREQKCSYEIWRIFKNSWVSLSRLYRVRRDEKSLEPLLYTEENKIVNQWYLKIKPHLILEMKLYCVVDVKRLEMKIYRFLHPHAHSKLRTMNLFRVSTKPTNLSLNVNVCSMLSEVVCITEWIYFFISFELLLKMWFEFYSCKIKVELLLFSKEVEKMFLLIMSARF